MGENEYDRGGAVNDRVSRGLKMRLGSALEVVCQPWQWKTFMTQCKAGRPLY